MAQRKNSKQKDAGEATAKPARARAKRAKKVAGFHIPPTLDLANAAGLKDVKLTVKAKKALLKSNPVMLSVDVPVGALWKIGWTDDEVANVCYRTQAGGCHWKSVPAGDIPDWDPDGPQ